MPNQRHEFLLPNRGILAIAAEAPWHRRKRQRRARGRKFLRAFCQKPRISKLSTVWTYLEQLENHHSRPFYSTVRAAIDRLRMTWNYGGQRKIWGQNPKGRGKASKGGQPKEKDNKDGPKVSFPACDSLPAASGSTSATTSTTTEETNTRLKEIILTLKEFAPEQAQKLLEGAKDILQDEEDDPRKHIKSEQDAINKRRKAHTKVLRLKETLQNKQSQFVQFKEMMKQQLVKEQERFNKETSELQEAIKEAELRVQALEIGIEPEVKTYEDQDIMEILEPDKQDQRLKQKLEETQRSSEKAQHMFATSQAQLKMYMEQCAHLRAQLDGKHRDTEALAPEGANAASSPMLPKTPNLPSKRPEVLPAMGDQGRKKSRTEKEPAVWDLTSPVRTQEFNTME